MRGTRCRGGGGIELVHVWLVVLIGDGIVDREGVGFGGLANGDAYHGFRMEGGATLVIIQFLVELGNGEEREPVTDVRVNMVEKSKRGGEYASELGWDLVGHFARV